MDETRALFARPPRFGGEYLPQALKVTSRHGGLGLTYAQRLDRACAERDCRWEVWSEWKRIDGFTRWTFWRGVILTAAGDPVARVTDYRPQKVRNGRDNVTRWLWKSTGWPEP